MIIVNVGLDTECFLCYTEASLFSASIPVNECGRGAYGLFP